MKKGIIITISVLIILLLAAAIIIPWLYKGKLAEWVKYEANQNLEATVDFDPNIGISLFRNFPNLSLRIDDFSVVNHEPFEGDTLFYAKRTRATVNLFSFLGDEIRVNSVTLDDPKVSIRLTEDGNANWDIMKFEEAVDEEPDIPEAEDDFAFRLTLSKYTLNNATVTYDDKLYDFYLHVEGADHSGSGDFTQDIVDLSTHTRADKLDMSFDGMPLLAGVRVDLAADLEMNLVDFVFTFRDNLLQLNEFFAEVDGFVGLPEEGVEMDIAFNATETGVDNIISLIPTLYTEDFDNVSSAGQMAFDGYIRGMMSETSMPGHSLDLTIDNGSFDHPDMPHPVQNLNLNFHTSSDGGDMDNTIVDLENLSFELDNQPFASKLYMETPISDPFVDVFAEGTLNLASLAPFMITDPDTRLAGTIVSDFAVRGNRSEIEEERYEDFDASGNFDIRSLRFESPDIPEVVNLERMTVLITPQMLDLSELNLIMGENQFNASGHLRNFLGYALNGFEINDAHSDPYFDFEGGGTLNLAGLTPFMDLEEGATLEGIVQSDLSFRGNLSTIEAELYEEFDFRGEMNISALRYNDPALPEEVRLERLNMDVTPTVFNLSAMDLKLGDSDLQASGTVSNFIGYAIRGDLLEGQMTLSGSHLNLNPWLAGEAQETAETTDAEEEWEMELVEIPENLSVLFEARLDQVLFDDWDIRNLSGALEATGGRLFIRNAGLEMLEGQFALDGFYEARDGDGEVFFDLDIENVSIPEAYETFVVVERFAPVAAYATGTFSGEMDFQTQLGNDFMPLLETVNSRGRLNLQGVGIENMTLLNRTADKLKIDRLKSMQFKDFRPSYIIENGRFTMEPSTFSMDELDFTVSGFNLLDGSIDYEMNMVMPGRYFNRHAGEPLAAVTGRDIQLGSDQDIHFDLFFTGTLTDPNVSTSLKDVVASATDRIRDEVDERRRELEEKGRREVDEAREEAREELERRRREAEKRADEARDRAEERAEEEKERLRKEAEEKKEEGKERIREGIRDRLPD